MSRFFSLKLYIQGLKKVRAVGIATAIIIIIANALNPLISLISELSRQYDADVVRSAEDVPANMIAPFSIFIAILAPLAVFSMFSFLNDRCKSDFYHSLPQRRECIFISFLAATLTWMLGAIIASHAINAILWAIGPYTSVNIVPLLLSLAAFLVLALLCASFATLATAVTGTVISNTLITLLFALFFRIIGALFLWGVEIQSNVFAPEHSPLTWLGFDYYLPFALFANLTGISDASAFANTPLIIFAFVTSLALLALSCLLFCKRRSECAGKSAPSRLLQHVWRIAITLPLVLLTVTLIVQDGFEGYHIVLLGVSLIIYLVFELMTTKKIKSMLRSIPMFSIPIVASVLLVFGTVAAASAVDSVTPAPEEIDGICTIADSYSNSYEEYLVSETFVSDDEAARIVSLALKDSTSSSFSHREKTDILLRLRLENGREIVRNIYFTQEAKADLMRLIHSSEELADVYTRLPKENEISYIGASGLYPVSDQQREQLWRTFCEEYETLTDEQKREIKGFNDYNKEDYGYSSDVLSITSISVRGYYKLSPFFSSYPIIPSLMPKTALLYVEMYNESASVSSSGEPVTLESRHESFSEADTSKMRDVSFDIYITSVNDSTKGFSFYEQCSTHSPEFEEEYGKFLAMLGVLAEQSRNTSFSSLADVYKVAVNSGELLVSPYASADNLWYEYTSDTFYVIISEEALAELEDIYQGKTTE